MFKNTASQKIQFYAFDSTTNAPKTGDAANITAYVSIDGGAVTVLGDTSASELSSTNAKGSYQFDLTQAETNGNTLLFTAKSGTANVVLLPVLLQTFPSCFGIAGGSAGGPFIAGSNAATTLASLTSTTTTLGDVTISDMVVSSINVLTDVQISGGFGCIGNFEIGGGLTVFANVLFSGNLSVAGNVHVLGGFTVDLDWTVVGDFLVGGGTTFTGSFVSANAGNDVRLGATERTSIAMAVWNTLTTALTTVGSIGKAIVDRLTGISGANNITITVTDGVNPVQGVLFSILDGAVLVASGSTNASGQSTFGAPNGTFSVALYKPNFIFAGTTRTVTGNQAGTLVNPLVMTSVAPPVPPIDPSLQTVYGTLWAINEPAQNAVVKFVLVPQKQNRPLTINDQVITFPVKEVTTDGVGFFSIDLLRTDLLDADSPAFYQIICVSAQLDIEGVELGVAPLDISTL